LPQPVSTFYNARVEKRLWSNSVALARILRKRAMPLDRPSAGVLLQRKKGGGGGKIGDPIPALDLQHAVPKGKKTTSRHSSMNDPSGGKSWPHQRAADLRRASTEEEKDRHQTALLCAMEKNQNALSSPSGDVKKKKKKARAGPILSFSQLSTYTEKEKRRKALPEEEHPEEKKKEDNAWARSWSSSTTPS